MKLISLLTSAAIIGAVYYHYLHIAYGYNASNFCRIKSLIHDRRKPFRAGNKK